MFAWLEEVEPHEKDFGEFKETSRIEQFESLDHGAINPISLYFLSSTILGEEADLFLHVIPFEDENTYVKVLSEVAPHFQKVVVLHYEDGSGAFNLSKVKRSSKVEFHQMLVNDEIPDIFTEMYKGKLELLSPTKLKSMKVIKEKIKPIVVEEAKELAWFFRSTYLKENSYMSLVPSGWFLQDSLKESLLLRGLLQYFEIALVIREADGRVVGIDICE